MKLKKLYLTASIMMSFYLFGYNNCYAQRLSIYSNALELITFSPNIGIQFTPTSHTSYSLDFSYSPWDINNTFSYTKFSVKPEFKYWFSQVSYSHYIGANILLSSYKIDLGKIHKTGDIIALGLTYGYSFIINERWNIIPNIGFGVGYNYDYKIQKGDIVPTLTKIGVTFEYIIM